MQAKDIDEFIDNRSKRLFEKYGKSKVSGTVDEIYATLSGELRNLVQAFFKPLKRRTCEYKDCKETHSLHVSHHHSKSRIDIAKSLIDKLKQKGDVPVKEFLEKFINKHKNYDSIYILCKKHHKDYDNAVKNGREEEFLKKCI
jgi:hypothetical protein